MFIIPYLVLAAVALLFSFICYMMFFGVPGRKKTADHREIEKKASEVPSREDIVKKVPLPKSEPHKEKKLYTDEKTQILPPRLGKTKKAEADEEKTKIFSKEELEKTAERDPVPHAKGPFPPEPNPVILNEEPDVDSLEEYFVKHFLNRYGAVSHTVEQDTRKVTHRLIDGLHMRRKEAVDTLTHIMVQEALQNAQRTYVMMPTDTVLEMVNDAFYDVAHGSRSDTKTILAYDALRAMPRMDESEFHALALLLLFHYSRNTDNYDAGHLKSYTEKYVVPFVGKLPDEYSGYQQLEYLHCVSLENKDIAFGQVLHDSYPLIFAFRGCMKAELLSVYPSWPEGSIVSSLYNSYYKPAAVDESMLSELMNDMGIEDTGRREGILAIVESRPVPYDKKEMEYTLGKISPELEKMREAWDNSMLRRSSLTLMGMYIAKICIRETIGEDFDLSHWM